MLRLGSCTRTANSCSPRPHALAWDYIVVDRAVFLNRKPPPKTFEGWNNAARSSGIGCCYAD